MKTISLSSLLLASSSLLFGAGCSANEGSEPEATDAEGDSTITSEEGDTTSESSDALGNGGYSVCARDLALRGSPGGGSIGTISIGARSFRTFTVQATSSIWVYGYAHSLGRYGWVDGRYLTNSVTGGYNGQYYYVSCSAPAQSITIGWN